MLTSFASILPHLISFMGNMVLNYLHSNILLLCYLFVLMKWLQYSIRQFLPYNLVLDAYYSYFSLVGGFPMHQLLQLYICYIAVMC